MSTQDSHHETYNVPEIDYSNVFFSVFFIILILIIVLYISKVLFLRLLVDDPQPNISPARVEDALGQLETVGVDVDDDDRALWKVYSIQLSEGL